MKYTYIIFIFLIVLSCIKKNNSSKISTIHVPAEQQSKLSDFVSEIEYHTLPIEINLGFFHNIIETEEHYIFADYDISMKIYVLDKQFNIVSTIDNYGEGPGEYQWIIKVNYNQERRTIEVLTNTKLIRFSINGEYMETVKIPFAFGNLIPLSKDRYIAYNKYLSSGYDANTYLISWNSNNNKITPLLQHEKNVAVDFSDRWNMFFDNGDVYATHIFMDTIYKIDQSDRVSKIYIDLPGESLPLKYLKSDNILNILNDQDIINSYVYHSPTLMVTQKYMIDAFKKNRSTVFFIENRITNNVISIGKIINDIDFGLDHVNPRFLDKSGYIYTIHEYEFLLDYIKKRKQIKNGKSPFIEFVEGLDPETGFVLIKYKLINF